MPLEPKTEVPGTRPQLVLFPAFALSGAAALIYQVCWQRILFTSFGVDIESTTIIVCASDCGWPITSTGRGMQPQWPTRCVA